MRFASSTPRGATRFRRPVLEQLESRAMLSGGMIELGPSDNIALDQPRVAVELVQDLDPDPEVHDWASVGPSIFNTFLLDTGANSVLAMATAVSDMKQPPVPYETEGEFEEVGIGGRHPMDISAPYRFDFAGTTGERNTLHNTRILSDADNDFSMFGPWGIAGMPAMADRVTTMDMRGWSGGGVDLDDLYMKVFFGDELPTGDQHRYALSVDNRLAFDPMDYLVDGEPPIWADIPFMTAIPTSGGIGQEGNFLFDTGAQMSLISQDLAIAIGLDSNGDGVLDHRDDAYLGSETIGGVGGMKTVPIFAIDEVRVPVTKVPTGETVELVWTDLQWIVLDIDLGEGQPVLDGVFGSDLLTSGWFHSFFYPGQPDGYIDQVHLDFRHWGLHTGTPEARSGTVYFDLNEAVDNIVLPGPGIRLRETARSTEVVKGVSTDTYTIGLETAPAAPVEITVTAEAPVLVSSDGGATFSSTLVVTLDGTAAQTITVMAEDDGVVDGPQTRLIAHTVASADDDYHGMAVRDVEVKVFDHREVVTITADEAGEHVITSIEVSEGGDAVTYWISLADAPEGAENWVQIEDTTGQVTVFNPNNIGDGWETVWFFDTANWNTPQPIRLEAIDDDVPEGPHQTQLRHTVLDPEQFLDPIVGQQFLTVYIADNDMGGVIITETGDGTHVTEGGATDTYEIALTTTPTGPVEITVTADAQTEVSDDDGATFASTLVLSFTDTTPQTVTVRAIDDDVAEGTHTGTITHTITGTVHDPAYPTTLPIADVTATITDNDSAGLATFADAQGQQAIDSLGVERGGDTRYWIALTSRPKHDVTVFLDSADDALSAADDANPDNAFVQFTPHDWHVPQAVRVGAGTDLSTAHVAHGFFSSDPNYQGSALLAVIGVNAPPVVAGVTAEPDPVAQGDELTLTAKGVSDPDGTVVLVEFWLGEVEGDGMRLGEGAKENGDWSLAVSTAEWALDEHILFARAQDNDGAWSEPAGATVAVSLPDEPEPHDPVHIGVHRAGTFYLDVDGDGGWNSSVDTWFRFGNPDDTPIAGDWNGDGRDQIGVHRGGVFYLDIDGDGRWDSSVDRWFRFGNPGDTPLVGDWNGDGRDQIGVHRAGTFYFDYSGDGRWNPAEGDYWTRFGLPDDAPIVGDWAGDGRDQIGVHRAGTFYFDHTGDGRWNPAEGDYWTRFGNATDTPIVGDWLGDGRDRIGVHRNGVFYLDMDGDGRWDGSVDRSFRFGNADDTPIIGNWAGPLGGQALHASGLPATTADTTDAGPALDDDALAPVVFAAIADWTTLLDLGADRLEPLARVQFVIADLPGTMLGLTRHDTIYLDAHAAGHGWFIDPTPAFDEEFEPVGSGAELRAVDSSIAERMDLLTVVSHELGHLLGLPDLDPLAGGLMGGTLEPGQRFRPGEAEHEAYFAALA